MPLVPPDLAGSPPPTSGVKELAFELMAGTRRLRRTVRRAVRRAWPIPALPAAQVEVLQTVAERPGVGVTEAAATMCLATNTVSTLVKHLMEAGLLRREPGEADRRAVHLALTPAAEERMGSWRDTQAQLVAAALAALSKDDRAQLATALPVLDRLVEALERG